VKNWINPEPNKLAGLDNVHSNSIHILLIISSPEIIGNTRLSIFNVSGENVMEMQLTENETQLDIQRPAAGNLFC